MKSLVIDSNVLLRFILRDIEDQYEVARKVFEEIEGEKMIGRISILVIGELIWILERFYDQDRKVFIPKIISLLSLKNIRIIEAKKELVMDALAIFSSRKVDFTDVYLSKIVTKKEIFSFDRDFKKLYR